MARCSYLLLLYISVLAKPRFCLMILLVSSQSQFEMSGFITLYIPIVFIFILLYKLEHIQYSANYLLTVTLRSSISKVTNVKLGELICEIANSLIAN